MKFSLLAAAALIAAPAMAQMSGGQPPAAGQTMADPAQTPDQTTPPADPAADPAAQPAPPAGDPAMTQQPGAPMPAQSTGAPMSGDQSMGQPSAMGGSPASSAGGYQPSNAGTMTPAPAGTQVQFRPQPTPDQAFPPPPAKESYPICKAGQYDGCMQASGGRKARRR